MGHFTLVIFQIVYNSVSQPPGRGPVPGPGINYARPSYYKKNNLRGAVSQRLGTTGIYYFTVTLFRYFK
jgi:hypothetical protein